MILTPELAERIEAVLAETSRSRIEHVAVLPDNPLGVELRRFGSLEATRVRRPLWYYHYSNGVGGARPGHDHGLGEALVWIRDGGQRGRVGVSPLAADEPFMARLVDLGLRPWLFMSILWGPAVAEQPDPPAGLAVREDMETFLRLRLDTAPEDERGHLRAPHAAEFRDWRGYVAYLDEEPAGFAAMLVRDGWGSMAAGWTAPDRRGRGCQLALLRRRIHDAALAGCDLVVSAAVAGTTSQRNMERAGLRLAYTRTIWGDATPR